MKYTIEFELPDNETVLQGIKNEYVKWAVWGYSGLSKAKPVSKKKQKEQEAQIGGAGDES